MNYRLATKKEYNIYPYAYTFGLEVYRKVLKRRCLLYKINRENRLKSSLICMYQAKNTYEMQKSTEILRYEDKKTYQGRFSLYKMRKSPELFTLWRLPKTLLVVQNKSRKSPGNITYMYVSSKENLRETKDEGTTTYKGFCLLFKKDRENRLKTSLLLRTKEKFTSRKQRHCTILFIVQNEGCGWKTDARECN